MTAKIKSLKTFCPIPWMHIALEPSGKVIPCCLTSTNEEAEIGNINDQSIESIWNGDRMKELRKQMINGEEPSICWKCFNREKVTNESGRIYHLRDFPEVIKKVSHITEEDGTCLEMKLRYWDFRFSNLCNYKCRSCGPKYSSAWVPDAKKLGWLESSDKVLNLENIDDKTNLDFLNGQIEHVEKIYFAGGEPLLMDEHWQILDLLARNNRFDVRINYNTNCSTLSYGKKTVFDYWPLWDAGMIEVWPSIDEIDERAELIRSGTVWNKVENNLKDISKLENIIVRPGMTIGAWNVFRLPEIITRLVDIGVIKSRPERGYNYDNFFINLLEQPEHYHVSILPEKFRLETIEKLNLFIQDYNQKHSTDISERFTHILHELTKTAEISQREHFIHTTLKKNRVRNENLFEVIPEMKIVYGGTNE
jgi:radical SAM protein with 4Fe4S-binding SPASM domain